jgi:AraC family transcriptional regulator of adaptative response/methylated-DNA-[protein]-cysteine methyltransferase
MRIPTEKQMRAAVAARDSRYDGRFVYGVISTGVFCRPSCPSRAARPENMRFLEDAQAARAAGFRPCRRCRPEEGAGDERMIAVARYIRENAAEKLTLATLARRAGLSPSRFQRSFKSTFGLSPKAFQDAARIGRLKASLQSGEDVTSAIFDAGYGSTSRVYEASARNIGMTPGAYRAGGEGESIAYACSATRLGKMMMAATSRGVCFVQFGASEETLYEQLRSEFPKADLIASPGSGTRELDAWIAALNAYLDEGAARPELPLDLRGTAFQMQVWQFLLTLSEGDVVSYKELAAGVGRPRAIRAAASACAANRIGVLVPCHRVLRGDGGLGGYRWGAARKRALLDSERARKTRES